MGPGKLLLVALLSTFCVVIESSSVLIHTFVIRKVSTLVGLEEKVPNANVRDV